jgi:hypothetical protein
MIYDGIVALYPVSIFGVVWYLEFAYKNID